MIAFLYPDIGYGPDDDTLVVRALSETDAMRARGLRPEVVAGYGAGEIGALYAAGGVDADTAQKAAALRAEAVRKAPKGGLLAVPGDVLPPMTVDTAAWNSNEEIVLTGLAKDLEAQVDALGGTWVHRGAPWYGWHLDEFVAPLLKRLQRLPTHPLTATWLSTRDGKVVDNPDAAARLLAEQIAHPVQWDRTLRGLYYQQGIRKIVFFGTSAAAARLVTPNVPQAELLVTG